MTGVIESKVLFENCKGYGFVKLKVLKSNIKHYAPIAVPYYCLINETEATFFAYVDCYPEFNKQIGDTVIVNTDSIGVFTTKGKLSFGTTLVQYDPFWEAVEKVR
jgi:hypothetical protein